ncbi:MFS transporter [Brevibacterium sediminis]|uniref:MFS transporter n=1 Tax=Brevibacterium sediminis TaxID=1857024 RepID=A0A5C4X412_9MICO|nr:MFS transporter [Brevibacterium sediminis]TNM56744.1 MFS transporter [Brevibacterium sediminis]
MGVSGRDRVPLPKGFNAWVLTSVVTELGTGILAFALTWVASGHGPHLAAWVFTLTVLPAVLLGLLGGAVADRFGPRRVMLACTLAFVLIGSGIALAVAVWSAAPPVLLAAAVLIGSAAAFYRPAVGVFPRLFVPERSLGTAMARSGMAGQLARTIAPPLGGILIGIISLSGVALLDVLGCLIMLIALLAIRPPRRGDHLPDPVSVRGIVDGVRAARTTPGVPALLTGVSLMAGAVIPSVLLGIPLAARERGWTAAEAGLIESGWIAGGLLTSAVFAWRGIANRVWTPMVIGPCVVALGLIVLAVSADWRVGLAATALVGAGVVVFTAHVFPVYVLLAPASKVSRFQSLLIVVQQAPQVIVNPFIGLIVGLLGTGAMIAAASVIAVGASFVVGRDRTLQAFRSE